MNIYVGNLHVDTNEVHLRDLFRAFGKVDAVNIITDMDTGLSKGFGFVEMADKEDGLTSIKQLNNRDFMGAVIEVAAATPRPVKETEFIKKAREEKAAKQKTGNSSRKK